jgi:hypothetical protein
MFHPCARRKLVSRRARHLPEEEVMAVDFKLNGRPVRVDVPDGTRLLWVLRERLQLTGTKYGCGVAHTPFLPGRMLAAMRT